MCPTSSPLKPQDTAAPSVQDPPQDGRNARWAEHRIARRQELVDATLRAIRVHGPGVGMDEIALEASTSKTVIYRHLGDRLGLYLAVCDVVDARILRDMDRVAGSATATANLSDPAVTDVLRTVIDSYLKIVERDPDVYRFVVRRPQVQLPDGTDPVTGLSSRIADNLTDVLTRIETASDPASSLPGRARTFAWALVGMVKESADRWLEDPQGLKRVDLAEHLASLAAHGLQGAISPTPLPAR